jgi:hypothetical protein
MMTDELLPLDLSETTTPELIALMMACGLSDDPSNRMLAKACRDELAKRKPDNNFIPNDVLNAGYTPSDQ